MGSKCLKITRFGAVCSILTIMFRGLQSADNFLDRVSAPACDLVRFF